MIQNCMLGNQVQRRGFNHVVEGKRYLFPRAVLREWMKEYEVVMMTEQIPMTCVRKYEHFALFETKKGVRVCLRYFDIEQYLKGGAKEADELLE